MLQGHSHTRGRQRGAACQAAGAIEADDTTAGDSMAHLHSVCVCSIDVLSFGSCSM